MGLNLKNSKCVHLRCFECGEIFHNDSADGMLKIARDHCEKQHSTTSDETVSEMMYIQYCYQWKERIL